MRLHKLRTWLRKTLLGETPSAATMEEWGEIDKRERTMPVRYFIAKTLPIWFAVKMMQYSDFKHWFLYRLVKKHKYQLVDTGLKPGYYDVDTRMLHSNFNMLKVLVEEELPLQQYWSKKPKDADWIHDGRVAGLAHLNWESSLVHDEHAGKELEGTRTDQAIRADEKRELYLWWVDDRPNRPDPWANVLDDVVERKKGESWYGRFSDKGLTDEQVAEKRAKTMKKFDIEEQYKDEDTEMLVRLMRVRSSLWT